MKLRIVFLTLAMWAALLLGLAGCGEKPAAETTLPTEAVISQSDALALYTQASKPILNATDLTVTANLEENRTVGSETYCQSMTGTLSYRGKGTGEMMAASICQLSFGSYETQYAEFYVKGTAYCQTSGCTFRTAMHAQAFLQRQIPALLLDASRYGSVSAVTADDSTVITFSSPVVLESWVTDLEEAQLITASGTATLDIHGNLLNTTYQARYSCGAAEYRLSVTAIPILGAVQTLEQDIAALPAECPTLSYFDAPKRILQVVGDVYSSEALSVSYTETLYSAAYARLRTQKSTFDTYGSGSDFMAQTRYEVSVTDYTNTAATKSEVKTFLDGSCTVSVNGGEVVEQSGLTAEAMRTSCEDAILAALFTPNHILDAVVSDTGDFLCIRFAGNDAFADQLCGSIYSLFNADLDDWAESFTTADAGGYLCVNKYTGLPTALGVSLNRTHVIDGVSYPLNYQLDQTMELSSTAAYENITGLAPEETLPEKSATPLFYRVTGENGQKMWLLGTIHVGDARTAALPQQIYTAFRESDALAVEFNLNTFEERVSSDPDLLAHLTEAYYYTDGTKTEDHVDKDLYAKLRDLVLASGCNSVDAPYYRTAIWWELIGDFYLRQECSLGPDKGVDQRLLDLAEKENKTVLEIESGLSQVQMLTRFSDALQAMLLTELLDTGAQEYCREIRQLYEFWCSGDEAGLNDALAAAKDGLDSEELALYEEYNKAMYTGRNSIMLSAAKKYLESGDVVFYAVGYAHLLGENGLIEALRSAGYTVEIVS